MTGTRRTLAAAAMLLLAGCEGYDRKPTTAADVQEDAKTVAERRKAEGVNYADEIEHMMQSREEYLAQLKRLEAKYLESGDIVKANWARQQREQTAKVMVYPFATTKAPEQLNSAVWPEQDIPEADGLYDDAQKLIQSFRKIPLAGTLKPNQDKARRAIDVLKQLIDQYPKSDKVDDAAYWIGECYKEYLRAEDPDNALAVRYYLWALELNPQTPHPVRFQAAVTYDYRQHDHKRALEMYRRVINDNETYHPTNIRYAQARIKEITDEDRGRDRPREEREPRPAEPDGEIARTDPAGDLRDAPSP